MAQPVARVEMVQDTHFGSTVADPYRWMEDWKGEELTTWVEAQGAHTREYLDRLPDRAALLERIHELGDASPFFYNFQLAGGRYFYLRRDPGEELGKLVVRTSRDAPEKVLVDPSTLSTDVHTAIDWFVPSRDGRLVAYGSSQGGSEESVLRVIDVDTGETLPDTITRTNFGSVGWLPDNRSFVYHRLREHPEGAPDPERYLDSRSFLHHLGDDPQQDRPVFGRGLSEGVEIAREDIPIIVISPASDWIVGLPVHGVLRELTIYVTPRTALDDLATVVWTRVADVEDAVTGFDIRGDTLFLLSHQDAPRYKVLATSAAAPNLRDATVVVPPSDAVIKDIKVAGNALLTRDLLGGIWGMRRVVLDAEPPSAPTAVPLPFAGTIGEWANEPGGAEVLLQMAGWTVSPRILQYDVMAGRLDDTGWLPPSPVDFSAIEAVEAHAPAEDGTLIPLSIIYRKGLRRDGNNPTLLMGYGSYGITIDPFFSPEMLAWYERGGVFAIAHMRGGGEYGEEWHRAGQKLMKGNTIGDFIACAEYLIADGYTRPALLAGEGTSAGGIPSGGALVRRPDLWAVMVIRVGVTNMLRFETSENGPPNVPEFGSVTTEEGFQGLNIMDSYSRVQDGVAYPAVMLTTGLNDPRVVVWQATKMAARLQAATSSGRPVLLRIEAQGGHGMGSTKRQHEEELADQLAFLLEQFDV